MGCKICGDDKTVWAGRYWFPDDGWTWGRLCSFCRKDLRLSRPMAGDFSVFTYAEKHGLTEEAALKALRTGGPSLDEVDDAIDAIYG